MKGANNMSIGDNDSTPMEREGNENQELRSNQILKLIWNNFNNKNKESAIKLGLRTKIQPSPHIDNTRDFIE